MVAPWTARRTVEHLGRNRQPVPAALLMLLLQDEEARAQVWHATAPSNPAHNYGTYGVDPLWWTPWSAPAALPVRSQASIEHSLLALVVILTVIPQDPTAANQTALNGMPSQSELPRPYWTGLSGRLAVIP